jgi:hypothetical protein
MREARLGLLALSAKALHLYRPAAIFLTRRKNSRSYGASHGHAGHILERPQKQFNEDQLFVAAKMRMSGLCNVEMSAFKRIDPIPPDILDAFISYSWPGNVRELQNLIERAVIRSNNGVFPNPLPHKNPVTVTPSQNMFRDSTRALIMHALRETGWVIGGPRGAATRLGLARTTLIAKMKKLAISRPVDHTETTHLSENVEGAEVTTGA